MTIYVSITGLSIKSVLHEPRFWYYAFASMAQARRASGNISAQAKTINGVRHTLTVWESEKAMRRFLYRGVHRRAIKVFPQIATGKTVGFLATEPPAWDEIHRIWLERGQSYTIPSSQP